MKMVLVFLIGMSVWAAPKTKTPVKSPLDLYIEDATRNTHATGFERSAGSLWTPHSVFGNLGTDLRAVHLNDILTIVVNEKASAVTTGNTKSARSSSAQANVSALAGVPKATSLLPNLLKANSQQSLDGSGTTSRETTLQTTLAARVTHVLPNGSLVIEGTKSVTVNSERQVVTIRGLVRPVDVDTSNSVSSDRIAQMEVGVNGKGVVGDSIRRPMKLYRILLGLLPF